jgi:hypothetical protein
MPATQTKGARAETLKCSAGVKGKEDAGATSALSAEEWQWRKERANGMRPPKNAIEAKAHSDDASKDYSKKEPSSKLERWALRTGQDMSGGGGGEKGGGELSVHNLSSHMADAAARGVDKDAAQSIAMESLSRQDASSCVGGGGGGQSRTRTVEIYRNPGAPDEVVGIGLTFGRMPGKWDGPCEIFGFVSGGNAGASGKLRPGDLIHEVTGTNIYKVSDTEVRRLIMGAPGTKLTLKVSNENDAPAAPTIGLKWEEIPIDRLWMCTRITHAALAAALERQLEFSNQVIQPCTHASQYTHTRAHAKTHTRKLTPTHPQREKEREGGAGAGGGGREREIKTEQQTDRQTDRPIDRHTQRVYTSTCRARRTDGRRFPCSRCSRLPVARTHKHKVSLPPSSSCSYSHLLSQELAILGGAMGLDENSRPVPLSYSTCVRVKDKYYKPSSPSTMYSVCPAP